MVMEWRIKTEPHTYELLNLIPIETFVISIPCPNKSSVLLAGVEKKVRTCSCPLIARDVEVPPCYLFVRHCCDVKLLGAKKRIIAIAGGQRRVPPNNSALATALCLFSSTS